MSNPYRIRFTDDAVGSAATGFLTRVDGTGADPRYGHSEVEADAALFDTAEEAKKALDSARSLFDPMQAYQLEQSFGGLNWAPAVGG